MDNTDIQQRKDDCLAMLHSSDILNTKSNIPFDIRPQTGGLFNHLLRIDTSKGVYFFKQYLDDVPNDIYDLPDIPARERALLAYQVQILAQEATSETWNNAVPKIVHFDKARNAFLMDSSIGTDPLINRLSRGEIPDIVSINLPKILASIHKSSFMKFNEKSIYANRTFRNFKLKLQYDNVADMLPEKLSRIVIETREKYQSEKSCVVHGDINSRNILIGSDSISIIDFEQSHLGSPVYDIAYILSEIIICLYCGGRAYGISAYINEFVDRYYEVFNYESRSNLDTELKNHIAIQILYRFWGPSRSSWTFYVDDHTKTNIIIDSMNLLSKSSSIYEATKSWSS